MLTAEMKFQTILALVVWMMVSGVRASDISTDYDVHLDLLSFKERIYPVQATVQITNNGSQPVDHLVWMFYPNRYAQKLPNINDVNLHRIYPKGYSTGGLNISEVRVDGALQAPSQLTPLEEEKFGHVFIKQQLPAPLAPGVTISVVFDSVLTVPHKFGSFGWYRNELTMSGGWSPVLLSLEEGVFHTDYQMPVANWQVKVDAPKSYQVVMSPEVSKDQRNVRLENVRQVSLKVGQLQSFTITKGKIDFVVYHDERKEKRVEKPFDKVLTAFADFVEKKDIASPSQYTLAQAPLREMLVVDGSPVSYYSDRAFKVIKMLQNFHEIPIYKSLFMQMYEQRLSGIEHERDLFWVQEVVAWRLTDELVESLKIKHRDARQIGVMRALKFMPLVDRVLYTPQFAFYDVFYNLVYPKDYVRDEIRRYPHRQPFGQTILAHMEDEFGADKTKKLIDAYIAELPEEGFRAFIAKEMDKDVSARFAQWVRPRPRINYSLGKHHTERQGDKFKHSISIEQDTKASMLEPVSLKVTYKDKTSETQKWMSSSKMHTFDFLTDQKIKAIEIDPDSRLLETTKSDNRRPAYWKFVILSMFVEYDFEENQPLFLLQGQFRKRDGGLDRFGWGGYKQFNSYGANLGYTRLFGKSIDALRLSHGFRVGLSLNKLSPDNAVVATTPDPSSILVTDSGFATDISLSYIFGNQLSYINPLRGSYGGLTLRVGGPFTASQYSYQIASFNLAGIVPLHPNHLWGMRFRIGTSGGSEMPSQLQLRLGGLSSMKGLPLTDDRFAGKHLLLITNEYRHFLLQDIDLNLGLFRVRNIQGALYSNMGNTTHTVQEQANVLAGLQTSTSNFGDLFNVTDWKVDAGYGIRIHIHYLGVSPSLISFDVARSVTDRGLGWLYYLGVNQNF